MNTPDRKSASDAILKSFQNVLAQNIAMRDALERIVDLEDDAGSSDFKVMSDMAKAARLGLAQAGAIENYPMDAT